MDCGESGGEVNSFLTGLGVFLFLFLSFLDVDMAEESFFSIYLSIAILKK